MRCVLIVVLVALACRRDGAAPAASASAPGTRAAATLVSSKVTDAELIAFVRWQRELTRLWGEQQARLKAATADDPSRPVEEVAREAGQRAVADAARFGPILKAHLESRPVQGERGILAEEAIGGVVHFVPEPSGARVVVTRDEERIGAARRRFGDKAVDDILAREPLIVAEAQRP